MGNSSHKHPDFKDGYILVQTDHAVQTAGSEITGKIYLRLFNRIETKGIQLEVKGKEGTMINNDKHYHRDSKEWYHTKGMCLSADDKILNPGDYVIPFTIVLPPTVPASFTFYPKFTFSKCSVRHFVIASIIGLDDCKLASHR